jgi:hypothetical protein
VRCAAEREADAGLAVSPFLALPMPALCAGFIQGIAAPMLSALGASLPFVADVALPLARANAAAWAAVAAGEAGAASAAVPERPRIGDTALECVAEHVARRSAAHAAAETAAAEAKAPMAAMQALVSAQRLFSCFALAPARVSGDTSRAALGL